MTGRSRFCSPRCYLLFRRLVLHACLRMPAVGRGEGRGVPTRCQSPPITSTCVGILLHGRDTACLASMSPFSTSMVVKPFRAVMQAHINGQTLSSDVLLPVPSGLHSPTPIKLPTHVNTTLDWTGLPSSAPGLPTLTPTSTNYSAGLSRPGHRHHRRGRFGGEARQDVEAESALHCHLRKC